MKLLSIFKCLIVCLIVILVACDSQREEDVMTGVVMNSTSCSGGPEPVFIIKLTGEDLIMTTTLPKEFQVVNKKIKFSAKESEIYVFCTTDKIYPTLFDVFNVVSNED